MQFLTTVFVCFVFFSLTFCSFSCLCFLLVGFALRSFCKLSSFAKRRKKKNTAPSTQIYFKPKEHLSSTKETICCLRTAPSTLSYFFLRTRYEPFFKSFTLSVCPLFLNSIFGSSLTHSRPIPPRTFSQQSVSKYGCPQKVCFISSKTRFRVLHFSSLK